MHLYKVLCGISIVLLYLARIKELKTPRETIGGRIREQTTLRLFIIVGSFMVVASLVELVWRRDSVPVELFVGGWLCGLSAVWIRRQAIQTLGKWWSLHVEIREQQQLIRSGPFRWVRHPTYLSMVLELVAFGLLAGAWVSLGVTAILFVPVLAMRIKVEEAALVEKFGAAYVNYQQQVPMLFPWRVPR